LTITSKTAHFLEVFAINLLTVSNLIDAREWENEVEGDPNYNRD
jgi:hypothetical protein